MIATRRTLLASLALVSGLAGHARAGESGWTPAIEAGGALARFHVSPEQTRANPFDDRLGFYAGASVSLSNGAGQEPRLDVRGAVASLAPLPKRRGRQTL